MAPSSWVYSLSWQQRRPLTTPTDTPHTALHPYSQDPGGPPSCAAGHTGTGGGVPLQHHAVLLSAAPHPIWRQVFCRCEQRRVCQQESMSTEEGVPTLSDAQRSRWGSPFLCVHLVCMYLYSPCPFTVFFSHPARIDHSYTHTHTRPPTPTPIHQPTHTGLTSQLLSLDVRSLRQSHYRGQPR